MHAYPFSSPFFSGNNIFQPGKEGSGEKGGGSGSGDRDVKTGTGDKGNASASAVTEHQAGEETKT